MKKLTKRNAVGSRYVWVEGHVVEKKGRTNCTLEELENGEADELAKKALRVG